MAYISGLNLLATVLPLQLFGCNFLLLLAPYRYWIKFTAPHWLPLQNCMEQIVDFPEATEQNCEGLASLSSVLD